MRIMFVQCSMCANAGLVNPIKRLMRELLFHVNVIKDTSNLCFDALRLYLENIKADAPSVNSASQKHHNSYCNSLIKKLRESEINEIKSTGRI